MMLFKFSIVHFSNSFYPFIMIKIIPVLYSKHYHEKLSFHYKWPKIDCSIRVSDCSIRLFRFFGHLIYACPVSTEIVQLSLHIKTHGSVSCGPRSLGRAQTGVSILTGTTKLRF